MLLFLSIKVMCSGGSERKSSQTGWIKGKEYEKQELHHKMSALLEFSATDDIIAFKEAIEKDDHDIDEVGLWYGRKIGSKEMSYEERTPLMIAALFGSKNVLSYILGTGRVDVNQSCGSDKATPLHCAVAGYSASSPEIVKLLINASADVTSVDAKGNKSSDLIVSLSNSIFSSRKRVLQAILEGVDDIDIDDVVGSTARTEKKDYRVDPSLPDIKNSLYSTDEFRMFTFKVKPCSRAYSHDWTECPFVHPGENARRRDPRKYPYSCVPCPEYRKGSCSKDDNCEYAHGIFESWLHPAQYRTRLCKDETGCNRRVCFFAHKPEELRPLYAATGSALPSPSASSVDSFALGSPTPSLTPSGGSSPGSGTMWQTQLPYVAVPTLQQLPISRRKTALNGRDSDLDNGLHGLENRLMRKLMMEEMVGLSSPSNWNNSMPNRLAGLNTTNLEDIFASQNANQQLWGYASDTSASNGIASSPMDPRYAAFSKRSQSFIECGVESTNSELHSSATPVSLEASNLSGWGSPDGKLDWSVRGGELNKLSKSSSFGFRNRTLTTAATTEVQSNVDEPDVSWVNSLMKDNSLESDQYCVEEQLLGRNGTVTDTLPCWPDNLYMEHEQMVA